MSPKTACTVAAVLPFAVWMAMMTLLPPSPGCYAARTAATFAALVPCFAYLVRRQPAILRRSRLASELAWGLAAGVAVFVVWVWPEQFEWYRRWFIFGEGGTVAVDESGTAMKVMRLLGSAFVISAAEELFFRRWLIRFAGFWWMVLLFAVEHDRWLVGALAGIAYGWLAVRKGLVSAIVAHAVTNLVLGLYVLKTGAWQFW